MSDEPGGAVVVDVLPPRAVQRRLLRKPGYADGKRGVSPVGPLLVVEDFIRHALLQAGIGSRLVTFAWFVVALIAHAFSCIGAPWAFVVGSIFVFVKVILDIADGEIGRFRKRLMTAETDARTHAQGIYLDRIQHAIESPLWGLALGYGAYRMTGVGWCLAGGIGLAICRSFWRFERILVKQIDNEFRERLIAVGLKCATKEAVSATTGLRQLATRSWQRAVHWIRNGKHFNLLILVAGLSDWLLSWRLGVSPVTAGVICSSAAVALIEVVRRIGSTQLGTGLICELSPQGTSETSVA